MVGSPYWNPHTETLTREELDALQVRKLADLVDWVFASAPWQAARLREAGVEPGSIASLEDLRRIPISASRCLPSSGGGRSAGSSPTRCGCTAAASIRRACRAASGC